MSDLFKIKETKYNLRNRSILVSTKTKTTSYGINSHLGPKIWDLVPEEIKDIKYLNIFNTRMNTCTCTHTCTHLMQKQIKDFVEKFFISL